MKKLFTFLLALAASVGASHAAPAAAVDGKLPGAFSVSATKKVYFSQGNLQYNSNTQQWQFADQQYTYVGGRKSYNDTSTPLTGNNNVTENGIANNKGIVDMFGWVGESSSWNDSLKIHGITSSTAHSQTDGYGTGKTETLKSDWGNVPNIGSGWFTLSSDEWNYLLNTRNNATNRRTFATVMGKTGMLIFPDDLLVTDKGLTVTIANYTTNMISDATEWSKLEKAGVVFLPAAGARSGTPYIEYESTEGRYWTTAPDTKYAAQALFLYFTQNKVNHAGLVNRNWGQSVRLVSTTPIQYTVTYNGNGNTSGSVPASAQYVQNTNVTVLGAGDLAKAGYIFDGWLNSVNNTTYTAGQTFEITSHVTLTAQWTFDVNAVNDVIEKINAIGEVAYTTDCKDMIDAARAAYDALTDEQKALASNYATLAAARARYAYLTPVVITPNEDPKNAGTYYSTYYDGNRLMQLPENVEAYVAYVQGDALMMQLIAESGDILPKATPVIFRSEEEHFTLTPQDEGALDMSEVENALQGVDAETTAPANTYVLSGTAEYGVGFYRINSENLKANKAYVVLGSQTDPNNAPRRLRFVFNEEKVATGMENVQSDKVQCTKVLRDGQLVIIRNGVEYNAAGQMVK